jgi:hypothetical protein
VASISALARLCGRCVQTLDADATVTSTVVNAFVRSVAASGSWGIVRNVDTLEKDAQAELARCAGAVIGALARRQHDVSVGGVVFPVAANGFVLTATTTASLASIGEDIRSVFRACHLPAPDQHFIAQGALASRGFRDAAALAARLKSVCGAVAPLLLAPAERVMGVPATMGLAACAGSLRPSMLAATEEHVLVRALDEYWMPRIAEDDVRVVSLALQPLRQHHHVSAEFHGLASVVDAQMAAQKLKASRHVIERVLTLHRWAVAARTECATPILVHGPPFSGKTTLLHAVAQLARNVNDKPEPRVLLLDATAPRVLADIAEAHGTAQKPLWVSVRDPPASLLPGLDEAARREHVVVFVELSDISCIDEKRLAGARVLATAPLTLADTCAVVLDRAAAADPHIWSKPVVHDVGELCAAHLEMALSASRIGACSRFTAVGRLVTTLSALLAATPQRTPAVTETLFWLATTWACGGAPSAEWDRVVAAAMEGRGNERNLADGASQVFVATDGVPAPWSELTAQQFSADDAALLFTPQVARGLYLAGLYLQPYTVLAIVGPPGAAKSALVRRLAADKGYSVFPAGPKGLQSALAEAAGAAKGLVVLDDDFPITPAVAHMIAAVASRQPHPLGGVTLSPNIRVVLTCRELSPLVAEVVMPIHVDAPLDVSVISRLLKDAKLDSAVASTALQILSDLAAEGLLQLSDVVRTAAYLSRTDRLLSAAEIASMVRAVVMLRTAPSHPDAARTATILMRRGLPESGTADTAFFYPNRAFTKRLVRGDREGIVQALTEAGLPKALAVAGVLRQAEAMGTALHAGEAVLVEGPWTDATRQLLAALHSLLVLPGADLEATPDTLTVTLSKAEAGQLVVLRGAAEFTDVQWRLVLHRLRDVARPRPLYVVALDSADLVDPSVAEELRRRCHVVSAAVDEATFTRAVELRAVDANAQLARLLGSSEALAVHSWCQRLAAAVQQHEASSVSFASWHREIRRRHEQLRFTQQVLLDLQRKPFISATEANYKPDGIELGLRAFEGAIEYNAYPEGRIRILVKIGEAHGKFSDLQHCTVWFEAPHMEVLQPPAVVGGQCRGRVDGSKFTFQTGSSYEFHVVAALSGDGTAELHLHGDVVDPTNNNTVVGRCYLKEAVEADALCREWVRYGRDVPLQEQLAPPELPKPEDVGMTAEELDRALNQVQNTLKRLIVQQDAALKDAVLTEADESGRQLSAALLPFIVSKRTEERVRLDAAVQRCFEETSGRVVPSVLSAHTCACALGVTDTQYVDWLFQQHEAGLPFGLEAACNATIVRARTIGLPSPIAGPLLLVDPWTTMAPWLHSLDGRRVTAEALLSNPAAVTPVPKGELLIVTDVTMANHNEAREAAQKLAAVVALVTADAASVAAWAGEYQVVDCACSPLTLERRFQAQCAAVAADPTTRKNAKATLTKAVGAETVVKRSLKAIMEVVGERVARAAAASGDRQEAYLALTDASLASAIADLEKARSDMAEGRSLVQPTTAAKKELDDLAPVAKRVACLTHCTGDMMAHVNGNYAALFSMRLARAAEVLRSGAKSLENISRQFLDPFMSSLLEGDRLLVVACIALKVSADRGVISPGDLRDALASFREPDVAAHVAFEAAEAEGQAQLKADAEQRERLAAQEQTATAAGTSKGASRTAKTATTTTKTSTTAGASAPAVGQRSPLLCPRWLPVETWVRVLAVHRRFAAFAQLPTHFQDADGSPAATSLTASRAAAATASKETRWREWFAAVGGSGAAMTLAPPGYEKEAAAVPAAAKAALLLAARPDRIRAALQMLAAELCGAEWVEGLEESDDVAAQLAAADAATPANLPIILACPEGLPANQLVAIVSGACARRKVELALVVDEQAKGKGKLGKAAAAAAAEEASIVVQRNGTQSAAALSSSIKAAAAQGHWILIDRVHATSAHVVRAILHATAAVSASVKPRVFLALDFSAPSEAAALLARTAVPRVAIAATSGLKESLLHAYSSAVDEKTAAALPPNGDWRHIVLLLSYVTASIEQRIRYHQVGFADVKTPRPADADLTAAVVLLHRLVGGASGRRAVPWDELREALACIIGSGLRDDCGKDVADAYIDWVLHPDVVEGAKGGVVTLGSLAVPAMGDAAAHRAAIEALATGVEYPEHFGLHAAAEARVLEADRLRLREALEDVFPADASSAAFVERRDKVLKQLPAFDDLELVMRRVAAARSGSAAVTALTREAESLAALCRAAAEALSRPRPDCAVVRAVAAGRVPEAWRQSFAAADLPTWLAVVRRARTQLNVLERRGIGAGPLRLNASLLQRPQRFIGAVVVDAMVHDSSVCPVLQMHLAHADPCHATYASRPADGWLLATFTGLALEGAALDERHLLADAAPDAGRTRLDDMVVELYAVPLTNPLDAPEPASESDDEFTTLESTISRKNVFLTRTRPMSATRAVAAPVKPLIRRVPRSPAAPELPAVTSPLQPKQHAYYAPLFRASRRNAADYIGTVRVPATAEHNHWVLRGATLHAVTDDAE